ncbi:type II secretion system protein [Parashewanella tropica]|uniref:type II secretion system protein n=1 Tax=Parashewanella tropica TaxID=2547970 RepID=UPI00105A7184|nr:prepilin-type N-terminal cleavage/methylation domain-containing protein [Parashewanella tropica]
MQGVNKGFTLIELVSVIVLLGILAVTASSKFINFEDDALIATHKATAASFKQAINLAHIKWRAEGYTTGVEEFNIYPQSTKNIDMNRFGWPAQSYPHGNESPDALDLNNGADCQSVWNQVLDDNSARAAEQGRNNDYVNANEADYVVEYIATAQCRYRHVKKNTLTVSYNAHTGEVSVGL